MTLPCPVRGLLLAVVIPGLFLVTQIGCSRVPKAPDLPEFDPQAAAGAALKQYDADTNGKVDAEEMADCPALVAMVQMADTDDDDSLSADEISSRIAAWFNSGTTIMSVSPEITLDGEALADAEVLFEPPAFLGDGFKPCRGTTDESGCVSVEGSDAEFPGAYVGAYQIRISKKVDGKETLPARYNTETELGCEVADDLPGVGLIEFALQSK